MATTITEEIRLEIQNKFDRTKSAEEKNQWGQYATPYFLASEIVKFVMKVRDSVIGRTEGIRFLEPAIGTGSFYSALLYNSKNAMLETALGIEKDNDLVRHAIDVWRNSNINIINSDFFYTNPAEYGLFNLVIANPPYVRHQHMDKVYKEYLKRMVMDEVGYKISGLSGLYCYFILLSHKWLAKDSLCAWLIPAEFMDVNYGKTIKQYLTQTVTVRHVHKYNTANSHFVDAIVSSAVIIYQNRIPQDEDVVRLTYGGTIDKPDKVVELTINELKQIDKWGNLFVDLKIYSKKEGLTLSNLFDIKRGIATGDNDFFILKEDEAIKMGFPFECLRPVLPSPRNLKKDIIEANEDGIPELDDRFFVIDTELTEIDLNMKYPRLWKYLSEGKAKGVTNGYLVKNRKIWYSQEKRKPAPFLCTYMGRGSDKQNPFKFVWNKSHAIATNTYILLYPKDKLKQILECNRALYGAVFKSLQSIESGYFCKEGREYGGGLKKIEPKELGNIPAHKILEVIPNILN